MSNQDLRDTLKNNIGNSCVIFTLSKFRYEGKLLAVLDDFIELFDTKKSFKKIIAISNIIEVDIK